MLLKSSDPNRMDGCLQLLSDCEEGSAAKSWSWHWCEFRNDRS